MDNQTVTIEVDATVRACAQNLRDELPDLFSELEAEIDKALRLLYQADQKLQLAQHKAAIIQGAEKLCALAGYEVTALKSEVPVMLRAALKDLRALIKGVSCKVGGRLDIVATATEGEQ